MPLFNIVLSNDTSGPNDPCIECPMTVHNIMGQEDRFRSDNSGERIENFLQARIVVTTSVDSDLTIDYGIEGNFNNTTGVISTDKKRHEVFFSLSRPGTVYNFKATVQTPSCGGATYESDVFYFETSEKLSFTPDSLAAIQSISVGPIGQSLSQTTENQMDDEIVFKSRNEYAIGETVEVEATISTSPINQSLDFSVEATQFETEVTIT